MYLDKAKKRAEDFYRLAGTRPLPCKIEEIEELERWIGHRFPEAYREFLLWMGRGGGGFLQGSDCFYRHLKDIQLAAQELLKEDLFPGKLPDSVFVFFMHQGYQFNFFYFDDNNDPPIYWYLEEVPTKTSFTQLYPCFSEFILTELEGHIKLLLQA
jgi:SMI1-KNR4 cell-wall